MNSKICIALLVALGVVFVEAHPAVGGRGSTQDPKIMCQLPAAKGHCRALLPRWSYNPETKSCQEFQFGGCDGNGNNFNSAKACMTTCGGI